MNMLFVQLISDFSIVALGCIAAITDLFTRKVPNKLLLIMLGIWICLAMTRVLIDFEYGMQSLIASAIGFLIGGGLTLIVYIISRNGLGAGDVKFMGLAGLYLSYRWVLAVMFVGGILCLISAAILMLLKKTKLSDALPLVPFLYAGIILTVFLS